MRAAQTTHRLLFALALTVVGAIFPLTARRTTISAASSAASNLLTTITVNTTADIVAADGFCSLREAIQAANSNAAVNECPAGSPGLDTIQFNLGAGTPSIAVTGSALPTITEPLNIDGATGGATRVELNGAGAGTSANGLTITGGNSTISGLVINRCNGTGLLLQTGGANTVRNCFIGTNAAGTAALGNIGGLGIGNSPNNIIGSTATALRNVIAGNNSTGGIIISGAAATGNQVIGNYIGLDASGTVALGNFTGGVKVFAANNMIGGTTAATRNVISGNSGPGVVLLFSGATNNVVQGNFIGTNAAGTAALANPIGVDIGGATGNTIGGLVPGAGNVIAFNTDNGVRIIDNGTTGNRILGNSIFANGGLGIDLGNDGVTPNDPNDADTGPNGLQNFPVLSAVAVSALGTTVQGSLNSLPNTSFRLEFFSSPVADPSGNGEGALFLGSTEVGTNAAGNVSFNVTVPIAAMAGHVVTATATDIVAGNTSEFSPVPCVFALAPTGMTFDAGGGNGSFTVTTGASCTWTSASSAPWITIIGGASGTGNGTVTFMIGANAGASSRVGSITVAGNVFSIVQGAAGIVLDEPLENGFPPGTVIIDGGGGGGGAATWRSTTVAQCQRTIPPPLVAPAAIVDAECAGPGTLQDEQLILPPFNATGRGRVFFEFDSFFANEAGANETGDVDVSLDGGQKWTNILRLQAHDSPRTIPPLDITAIIAPNPTNVRIRFHYYGALPGGNRPSSEQFVFWLVDRPTVVYFSLSTSTLAVAPSGGAQSITVTAAATRSWVSQPPGVPWITGLTAGGTGTALVNFTVAPNTAATPRLTPLMIAGNTLTVTQSGLCAGITINPPSAGNGFVGMPYSQTFTASGGTAPYTFSASGTLPPNVTLNQTTGVLSGMPTTIGSFTFTVTAADAGNCANSQPYTVVISGNGLQFYPLPRPLRLLDTRAEQGPCDNLGASISAGGTITVQARVNCDGVTIPAPAQTIVGNLTVINQSAQFGFVTLFPCGPLPLAANMIYAPGQLLSNNFTVGLNANGEFCLFAERTMHVVIDVSGYFAPPTPSELFYHALPRPLRLLDTRPEQSLCDNIGAPIAAGTALTTQARITCSGITIPVSAQAVNGNLTVINQTASFGFLTLFPAGQTLPLAANMIYAPGQLLANAFVVGLSGMGEFNTFGERTIHAVVDVSGYFAP